jgi:aromatic-L-amino-acid decarboxylase
MYLMHTKLSGKTVLRIAIGGTYTERRHVLRAWELIREAAGSPRDT